MWDELESIGIEIGMLTNRKNYSNLGSWNVTQPFDYNGEPCDNSVFVFDCYEGNYDSVRNEYNIYIS